MIKLLIPDMPKAHELLPFLQKIDANRLYTNFGPLNTELEVQLKEYLQRYLGACPLHTYVTTIANATLGLEVVFQALNIPLGSLVLLPSLTFPATASAVLRQGHRPIFSDIQLENWMLTPALAYEAIKQFPSIRLVVPVAAFGVPVDIAKWDEFTKSTGIPVVVDAAGAFGNQTIGKHCHVVFSLHATKMLGGGEGGFVVSADQELIAKIRRLSNFGIEASLDGGIIAAGTNAKMSEYHAAVALASLQHWAVQREKRINLLSLWLKKLEPFVSDGCVIFQQGMSAYSHSLLPIRFKNIENIASLAALLLQRKIQTRRWYYPLLPHHPAFSPFHIIGKLESAEIVSRELLGLPFHLELTEANIQTIVCALEDCLGGSYTGVTNVANS